MRHPRQYNSNDNDQNIQINYIIDEFNETYHEIYSYVDFFNKFNVQSRLQNLETERGD